MFTGDVCKTLIETYQSSDSKQRIDNFFTPQFTQVNLNELNDKGYQKFTQILCYKILEIVKEYKKIYQNIQNGFQKKYILKN